MQLQLSREQANQPACDGQTKPGAAEAVHDGAVRLHEVLEDPLLRCLGDADARVRHLDAEMAARGLAGHDVGCQEDGAGRCEFHRVAEQVDQDFAEMLGVTYQVQWRAGGDVQGHPQTLLPTFHGCDVHDLAHQFAQVELDFRDRHLPGLDPRQVEYAVDEREQGFGCVPDGAGHLALLGVQARCIDQAGHADDGVQRCPQLVADAGKEQALGLVRGLGVLPGVGERPDQGSRIERDRQEAGQQPHPEWEVVRPIGREAQDKTKPK